MYPPDDDLTGESTPLPPTEPSEETLDHDPANQSALETSAATASPDETTDHRPGIAASISQDSHAADTIGTVLAGKYTLIKLIGEGGMGSVYLARQNEPVKRDVALKLIKGGMDTRAVLTRFEAERQALALMDHPNIARVFDGGTTPSGQPFFVMEHVRGVPITDYCDANRLSPTARLSLFEQVCNAVQHAHQKGIIHRDLKPGNVLVIEVDGRPTPKVIDFGVAKATEQRLTDQSFSDTGLIVGTPTYMSPEQADPSSMDIDTRTDVYALGVMLYELLTGSPPIDARQFQRGALLEMLRMVREVEPPRPSTRLSTALERPTIAARRNVEPAHLLKWLRGDIDWIVMKALEKDRNRRYETANGFAADIRRFLANEPVVARPPSRTYRLRKFVRRNRGAVVAASLVLLALVTGVVGTTLGFLEARKQRDAAVAAATAETSARLAEATQRKAAEQANRQAFDALKSFTDELMGKLLGSRDQLSEVEKSVIRSAQKQWEVFAQSKGDSPEARVIRAEGAAELSILQYKLGMNTEAEANDRAAMELRAALATDFPDVPEYRLKLGMSHQNLGASLRGAGNRAEAEVQFQQAVVTFERLVADFPSEPQYRRRLAASLTSLANAKRDRMQWTDAEAHYRQAETELQRLVQDFPDQPDYRSALADANWGLAFILKRADRPSESEAMYRQALSLKETLCAESPTNVSYRQQAANLGRELGVLLYDNGNDEAGAAPFPKAIAILEELAAEYPSLPEYRYDLSRCLGDYGKVLGYLHKPAEALRRYQKAIDLSERLVSEHPTVLPYQASLGRYFRDYANTLRDGGSLADSLAWYDKAIATLEKVYEKDRQKFLNKSALSKSYEDRASTYDRLGQAAEALPDWDRALELCEPEMRDIYLFQRVDSRLRSGQVAEALAELDELARIDIDRPDHWYNFACLYALASAKIEERKDELANRAIELLQKAASLGFDDAPFMAQDPDLAPLRDRDDFKKLLADIERRVQRGQDSFRIAFR